MAQEKKPTNFFIVRTNGTPLTPNTPKRLQDFAKTVAYNRTPLHAMYSDGKLTLGTLIFNRGLKSRFLGRGACVVCSQHDVKSGDIRKVVVRHFDSISSIKDQADAATGKLNGLDLAGAHFINFSCDSRYNLKVGLDEHAPKDAIPLDVFTKFLNEKSWRRRKALGADFDNCLNRRLDFHTDYYNLIFNNLEESVRKNPKETVEKGKLTFCQSRKPFLKKD